MLFLIAVGIFLIVVASTWWFGLWSNLITLINLIIAGLIASSFFENMAGSIDAKAPTFAYITDFASVWIIFFVTFGFLRMLTDLISSMRLKFDPVTEMIGRSILSIWIALVFISFSFFTLHMAPLPPGFYGDTPTAKMLGVGPDRFWLAFIQSRSRGALSDSSESTLFGEYSPVGGVHPNDVELKARVFDPHAQFVSRFALRRTGLSQQTNLRTPE